MSLRIAYIVTHPIQYQAPLLKYLAGCGDFDLQVFFLSDFSLHAHYEHAFKQTFKWDTELTNGYRWELLPRRIIGPSTPLRRWLPLAGLRRRLRAENFAAVWVHGWAHVGLCQAIQAAAANHIPVLFRGEALLSPDSNKRSHLAAGVLAPAPIKFRKGDVQPPLETPVNSSTLKSAWSMTNDQLRGRARAAFYRNWLLPRVAACLYIGARNREFYQQHQVTDERLFSMPYAVDNDFFQQRCADAQPHREELRAALGLAPGRPVVLFAGKLTAVKAPQELLAAFASVHQQWHDSTLPYLLFAGDGPLRSSLAAAARPLGDSVRFLGFRNQSELPALYDLGDLFVLPSNFEPWGLVVNEAMNAARPIIVSHRVGAAADLVENGKNGFVYRSGNVGELAAAITRILESANLRDQMGRASRKRISAWNFAADRAGLLAALSQVTQANDRQEQAFG